MKYLLQVFALFLAVGCGKSPSKPDPVDTDAVIEARYAEVYTRLTSRFIENGWVVSRDALGAPEHQGEGLLWTGILLSVEPCSRASIEDALIATVISNDGALVRYTPLGEYAGGREVTLDGALGLYRGIMSRVVRCPDTRERWDLALTLHRQYLATHDNSLNVAAPVKLDNGFEILPDVVAGYKDEGVKSLLTNLVAWSAAVNATHSAAYRVHLAYLTLQTLEDGGYSIPAFYRDGFCAATRGVDIPTVDHYCGRGNLLQWINNFQFNVWEYRFQRSGSWEAPDGATDETPGLDYLVAVRQYFK